jgi:putative ABC transport system permease protein
MIHGFKIAFRNVLRNRRRSLATVAAIAISCAAIVLFAGYMSWIHRASENSAVSQLGHLRLFQKGFTEEGAGNPAAYAIEGYEEVKARLLADPFLGERIHLITGELLIQGLASSARQKTTAPFLGLGVFPEEHKVFVEWNPYDVFDIREIKANQELFQGGDELASDDPAGGSLGVGLAKILKVNPGLPPDEGLADAAEPEDPAEPAVAIPGLSLAQEGGLEKATDPARGRHAVELLSLPPEGGVPNMTTLYVRRASPGASSDLDNRLIMMPIRHASELVFPGEEIRVTAIALLLKDARDSKAVAERLHEVIESEGYDFEVKSWMDLLPDYVRSLKVLDMFFVFTLSIVSVVLLFLIFNTIYMGVVERTREIGTLRAMGMSQRGVIGGFLMEGSILGLAGAAGGVLMAIVLGQIINAAEIVYHPPMVPYFAKVEVFVLRFPIGMLVGFTGCFVVAVLASVPAARRAARMVVADALRD